MVGLCFKGFCGCCRFLYQRGVLLCNLIHLADCLCDLLNAATLFIRGRSNLAHDVVNARHRLHNLVHGFARGSHQHRALIDAIHGGFYQRFNLFCRLCATLRQVADFSGDHRKASALLAGACRFHRGIQRQDVGLERDAVNHPGDIANFLRAAGNLTHGGHHFAGQLAAFMGGG